MKKAIMLLSLFFMFSAFLFSQNIQYEVKVTYHHDGPQVTADITVSVKSGTPDFIYYLTTNHPIKGETLMKSGPVRKRTYTFNGVVPGKYFVKIEDKSGEQTGKTVEINNNEN